MFPCTDILQRDWALWYPVTLTLDIIPSPRKNVALSLFVALTACQALNTSWDNDSFDPQATREIGIITVFIFKIKKLRYRVFLESLGKWPDRGIQTRDMQRQIYLLVWRLDSEPFPGPWYLDQAWCLPRRGLCDHTQIFTEVVPWQRCETGLTVFSNRTACSACL